MTRDDIKKLFPEATDDQITRMLNQMNSEVQAERSKADKYKAEADKVSELEKQIKDLSNQNVSGAEKAAKDLEDAQKRIAELEKAQAIMSTKKSAMEKFHINAEQADKVIREDGSLDFDALGQIMSEKETAAATAKEQEIAKNQGNPGGSSNGDGKDEKPDDLANIETINFGGVSKEATAVRDYYK